MGVEVPPEVRVPARPKMVHLPNVFPVKSSSGLPGLPMNHLDLHSHRCAAVRTRAQSSIAVGARARPLGVTGENEVEIRLRAQHAQLPLGHATHVLDPGSHRVLAAAA